MPVHCTQSKTFCPELFIAFLCRILGNSLFEHANYFRKRMYHQIYRLTSPGKRTPESKSNASKNCCVYPQMCHKCEGSGSEKCRHCMGSGTETCSRCLGKGTMPERVRRGDEYVYEEQKCPNCDNGRKRSALSSQTRNK